MTLRVLHLALAAVFALSIGCSRKSDLQTKEAVRQGVIDHLSKRPNLDFNQMQVEVASVNFRGNEADAVVSFRPKGAAASGPGGMEMRYTLEQKNNRWVVKGRSDMGGSPHGGAMAPGAGMGGNPHEPQPGKQPGAAGGNLPPDHPMIGGSPKPSPEKGAPPKK